jgi:hypothetical protein
MSLDFANFTSNFFLDKDEVISYKDHGKNSAITIRLYNFDTKPAVFLSINGTEINHQLTTFSFKKENVRGKIYYEWRGLITQVSARHNHSRYTLAFRTKKTTVVSAPIRVYSKQKKRKRIGTNSPTTPAMKKCHVYPSLIGQILCNQREILKQLQELREKMEPMHNLTLENNWPDYID